MLYDSSVVLADFRAQVLTGQRSAVSQQRILHVIQNIEGLFPPVWGNPRVLNPRVLNPRVFLIREGVFDPGGEM